MHCSPEQALPGDAALRVLGAAHFASLHAQLAKAAKAVHTLTLNAAAVTETLRAIDLGQPALTPLLGDRALGLTILHSGGLAEEVTLAPRRPAAAAVTSPRHLLLLHHHHLTLLLLCRWRRWWRAATPT